MDNDTSWCPVCDRQIQPKRYQVPVVQPTPIPPAPPPSSPESPPVRRTKTSGNVRQRGGLVQGMGRVKPNGTIRRADPKPQPQPVITAPVKLRTVIDQGPTPLYCSDECQLADLNRGLPHDFNPDRQRSSDSSPVSFSPRTVYTDSTTSSFETQSSVDSTTTSTTYMSPSLAKIAEIYHFPPPPPCPPVDVNETPVACPSPDEYCSGIMMAARHMNSVFSPQPQKRDVYGHIISSTEPRKPIPGWTDGSNAWRSTIYSLTTSSSSTPVPHKSFATRSSKTVQSNLTGRPRTSSSLQTHTSESDAELLNRFSRSFKRTSQALSTSPAPLSSSPSSPDSFPITPPPQKRERSLLQPGAEGKLLVPQVMMRVNSSSASSFSLSSQWSSTSRTIVKSPLSQTSSKDDRTQRCSSAESLHQLKRPTVEVRSWSYDNIKTYPIMRLPPKTKTEERRVMHVVDGVELETLVEVEVEIEEKLKRLFLFPAPTTTVPA